MKTYEDLTKERNSLWQKIQEQKVMIDSLQSGAEKSKALADLASLRIRYANIQEDLLDYYKR